MRSDHAIFDSLRFGGELTEEEHRSFVERGLVTHSVDPDWTAKGRALWAEYVAVSRAAHERRQRAVRYLVISSGRRTSHLNYDAALADFNERRARLRYARMELRRGGSMEAVAFWDARGLQWCNGWPERGDRDSLIRRAEQEEAAMPAPGGAP